MTEDKAPQDSTADEAEATAEPVESATQRVIGAFGGIRPMANKLDVAVSTVQGWKERDAIPPGRHGQIRDAAARHGIVVADDDLAASAAPAKEKTAARSTPGEPDASEPPLIEATAEVIGTEPPEAASPTSRNQRTKVPDSGGPARAADEGSAAPAAEPDSPPRAAGGRLVPFFAGAAVAALGFGLAVLTVDYWGPGVGPDQSALPGLQQGLKDLRGDLAGQAKTLSDLESALAALPAEPPGAAPALLRRLDALDGTLGGLTKRLDRLEKRPAGSGLSAADLEPLAKANRDLRREIAALEQRFAALERSAPALAGLEDRISGVEGRLGQELAALAERPAGLAADGGMAVVLALIQLRDALAGPGPYGAELDLLSRAVGDDPGTAAFMAPLHARAATGIPTLTGLIAEFDQVAAAVVAAGAGDDVEGPMAGVLRKLSDVVTVRPVGDIEGTGPGAVVARAEHRLRAGDLPGALGELDGLQGAAAQAAASWRSDAEARVAADKALAALGAEVVTRLAQSGG